MDRPSASSYTRVTNLQVWSFSWPTPYYRPRN